ncbi:response regulator [Occallatibacter riparius]|uniref:Response regulator n=1 Tax=Occallatibacter riparius TaxID=1002689 RepID=A0A9J7BMG4_9BACT|nr:response regulator [Occallatibacter riparius]UWZ84076.1 response regulator [Occallatibacter riparius]
MRALIVDDSRFTRRVVRGLLEQAGFECKEANDAAAGLALLLGEPDFDVALIDWNMPGMNGLDMVKNIRAQNFDDVKVMMVTSQCDSNAIVQALEAGADEYLMKPFDAESLREKLALLGLNAA